MKLLKRLGRTFRREYRTDRLDRYLRVAKVMGAPDDHIQHEMDHIRKGEELGHKPRQFILIKDPFHLATYLAYSREISAEDMIAITSAPHSLSDVDEHVIREAEYKIAG